MCDRLQRESPVPSRIRIDSSVRKSNPVEARVLAEQPGQEREEHWRRSLSRLEEWICELLIKNQELRMELLDSTTNQESEEADQRIPPIHIKPSITTAGAFWGRPP